MNTKTLLICALLTAMFAALLTGCGPARGYAELDGEWCFVLLGGLGDKPTYRPLNADHDSFEVFTKTGYAKDKTRVFYSGREVERVDSNSFRVDNDEYARDKSHVFMQGVIVQKANPETFEILPYPYGKDDQRAFCGSLPIEVDDVDKFRVTKPGTNVNASVGGFDVGYLNDYHEELDPEIDLIYGTLCRARTDHQEFQGPIRVK